MKMNIFIPALYSHKYKIFGLILMGILVLCLIETQISLVRFPWDIRWIKLGMLFALTIMGYSKEKNETERIRNIRIISQHYAFQFVISLTIAYYLVIFIFDLPSAITALDLIFTGMALNATFFYTIKWFGKTNVHLSYKSLSQIVGENKLLILIWSILTLITILTILII